MKRYLAILKNGRVFLERGSFVRFSFEQGEVAVGTECVDDRDEGEEG